MKQDAKLLLNEVEKKVGKRIDLASDFEKLAHLFSLRHVPVSSMSLKKVWAHVQHAEKPSRETLDKLALFVGFQDWESFKETLHGDTDASVNYKNDRDK
ncbi:MAG: hypothetical protein MR450_11165 [Prevotella sp.]|nr:hypothetical protein [Prevotella sp.]MDY4040060.1 hypothetical protein [Prevotella sp.]